MQFGGSGHYTFKMASVLLLRNSLRCSQRIATSVLRPSAVVMRSGCLPIATTAGNRNQSEFWEKNARLNRPISPHMTIWKWELPPILSTFHRGTGVAMTGVTTCFALAALASPYNFEFYVNLLKGLEIPWWCLFSAKTVVAWPLSYHMFNGIRHLFWDMGFGFDMDVLYKSGYSVVIGATVVSPSLAYFL